MGILYDKAVEFAELLSADDMRRLHKHLHSVLGLDWDSEDVVDDGPVIVSMGAYQQKYIKCGKSGCKCANGQGHGPYWYLARRVGDTVHWTYIGKELPSNGQ